MRSPRAYFCRLASLSEVGSGSRGSIDPGGSLNPDFSQFGDELHAEGVQDLRT